MILVWGRPGITAGLDGLLSGLPAEEETAVVESTHDIFHRMNKIYPDFGEIRVYAPRVGVAAGAKPKGYPDFGEIRV